MNNNRPIKDHLKTLNVKPTLGRTLTKEYLKKMKIKRSRKK